MWASGASAVLAATPAPGGASGWCIACRDIGGFATTGPGNAGLPGLPPCGRYPQHQQADERSRVVHHNSDYLSILLGNTVQEPFDDPRLDQVAFNSSDGVLRPRLWRARLTCNSTVLGFSVTSTATTESSCPKTELHRRTHPGKRNAHYRRSVQAVLALNASVYGAPTAAADLILSCILSGVEDEGSDEPAAGYNQTGEGTMPSTFGAPSSRRPTAQLSSRSPNGLASGIRRSTSNISAESPISQARKTPLESVR